MAKNEQGPAFPFYAQDFLVGVMHLENSEIGAYVKLLAYQWVNGGPIHKSRIESIVGNGYNESWPLIEDKFSKAGENLFNVRMEEEREKRAAFQRKQSKNGSQGGRGNKKSQKKAKPKPKESQKKPLENEDDNEKDNKSKKEKEIENEKIIKIFNAICKNLPSVKKLTPKRISSINARIEEYNLKTIGDVFILVSQSAFLNGDNDRGWTADFDWIMNPNNFIKILEQKYNNGKTKQVGKSNVQYSEEFQQKIIDGLRS